jgi:vacuolar-type H+-ATPase subunit H
LERKNQELMERLSVVERKTHSADLARIDKAIEDQELRLQYAKMKIAEAATAADGAAMTDAQEMMYEARRQIESLSSFKKSAVEPRQTQGNVPDPRLQRLAANWMEKNDWYDPSGRDTDSKIAKQIDETLVAEGWNPTSQDYWEELDNRLHKYLPHKYNDSTDVRSSTKRPRSVVTSSGRESVNGSTNRNTFVLKPEQVRAMKDAGFWDDPDKRSKMIKRYAQEARNNSY